MISKGWALTVWVWFSHVLSFRPWLVSTLEECQGKGGSEWLATDVCDHVPSV